MNASVLWEGEQVVSAQEKAGLPPPGRGSQEEDGRWEGRPGTKTGHPSLPGIEGQTGDSNHRNRIVLLFITRTRFQHWAVSLPRRSSPKKPQ